MPELIKDQAPATDSYRRCGDLAGHGIGGDDLLLPLPLFLKEAEGLAGHAGKLGVLLEPADELEPLVPHLKRLDLVAIHFPAFTDGRGFSLGRLLRERHGFTGELRAVGDVFRDNLFYLWRCGFNAFELRPGETVANALKAFHDFSEAYQASADRPAPLFRRRFDDTARSGKP